jgi:tRNA(Ile)-lysidine synthase
VRLAPVESLKGLAGRNYSLSLVVPGTYDLPHVRRSFSFKLSAEPEGDQGYNSTVVGRLDWERTPRRLWLRNWRPGDRYHPLGWSGEEKLKTLFQQHKVPLWERGHWPVLATETEILWARRFGPAAALAASPGSKTVLEIREQENTIERPVGGV